jgi:ribosomal protein S18 acetylase RimI-like enzyme
MKYRNALPEDKTGIKSLISSSFTAIYAYYAMKSFSKPDQTLIATQSGNIIGVINWRIFKTRKKRIGYLYWVAVDRHYRRQGIGRSLMKKAMAVIRKESGSVDIFTAVEKDNKISQKLLEYSGYRKIERKALKQKFGKDLPSIRNKMMLMPWEDLFVNVLKSLKPVYKK